MIMKTEGGASYYVPSPEEIAEGVREIQSKWTDRDFERRYILAHSEALNSQVAVRYRQEPMTVPRVSTSDLE